MADIIIKQFDSPGEFLEWATNAPCLWRGDLASREVSSNKTEWTGTRNYEAAYDLAKYGWPEGLKMLAEKVEIAQQVLPPIVIHRRRHDVAGHYPSPARAAAGEIFSMVHKGETIKQKPIARIRHNFVFNGNQSTQKVMNWGAALCSYIEHLQQAGHPVELMAIIEASSSGPSVSFQFPLKKAGQHLSMASMVFWWAHPSVVRRIYLSACERLDIERWYSSGYGRAARVTNPESDVLNLAFEDAGDTIEQNLKTIHDKHMTVIAANANSQQDFSIVTGMRGGRFGL